MSSTDARQPAPFFGPAAAPPGRRILLLSYHFPPATTAGALRWQKFAAVAAERGWGLDVITLDPSALTARDDGRFGDLPAGTRLYGVAPRTSGPERVDRVLSGLVRAVRGRGAAAGARGPAAGKAAPAAAPAGTTPARREPESLTPDQIHWSLAPAELKRAWGCWIAWSRDDAWSAAAGQLAQRLLDPALHRVVISCGPPHMVHAAASHAAARAGLPHVMDLRDPWSQRRRLPAPLASPLWLSLAKRHEVPAVARAALVVANTDDLRQALAHDYPAARVITVMNGMDDEAGPPRRPGTKFVVAYAGALYLDRDPRPLFAAAARIITQRALAPEQFGILLVGETATYENRPVREFAADAGIAPFVEILPRQNRKALFDLLADAAVLLSLQQDSAFAVPSKVFEYLQFEAWVVAISGPGTPTARVLEGVEADVLPPGDTAALEAALDRLYARWAAGERPGRPRGADRLHRRAQAAALFDALDQVTRP